MNMSLYGIWNLRGSPKTTDIDMSYLHEGGFRVVEDGKECTYEWKVESKSLFSAAQIHTPHPSPSQTSVKYGSSHRHFGGSWGLLFVGFPRLRRGY